jgi:hypothetical protein
MKAREQANPERGARRPRQSLVSLVELKLGFRPEEAAFIVGSPQLWQEMVAAGWVRPVIHRHKLLLYDRGDISRAWARILSGEQPPRRQRISNA